MAHQPLYEKTETEIAVYPKEKEKTEIAVYPKKKEKTEIAMNHMDLDEALKTIDAAIAKKKKMLDGFPERPFTAEDNMKLYDLVYKLCSQKPPHDYSMKLYEKYESILKAMIVEKVLPLLMDKHGTLLLEEVIQLWSKYEALRRFLFKSFHYLDRYVIPRKRLPSLDTVSNHCFRDLVCDGYYHKLQETTIDLTNQDREGRQIDRELLKHVLDFFVKMGQRGAISYYEKFEQIMLAETVVYYSQLSSEWWFWRDSYANYLRKVDWCLVLEERRAELYPCPTTKIKVLEVMKYLLLEKNAKKLAEKQKAEGCDLVTENQEFLSKYTSLNLEDVSSVAVPQT